MRSVFAVLAVALTTQIATAHGGRFRPPGGGVAPGLPSQPTGPEQSGGSFHSWLTWWGYNQFKYLNYKTRQIARRGAVTGKKGVDPNAWRANIRKNLTPTMMTALNDRDEEVRTAAAVALGKWRVKDAIERLKKLRLADNVQQVREAALLGLVLMREPALHDYFKAIAKNMSARLRVRGFALLGLGLIGDQQSRDFLFSLLDSRNTRARSVLPKTLKKRRELLCAAVAGLTYEADSALGDALLKIAMDKRLPEEVRAYALAGLGKVRAKKQLPQLVKILKRDRSEHMRRSAAIALGVLATKADEDVLAALTRAVKHDKDRIVGHYSVISLGQLGGPQAFKALAQNYKRANKEARGFYVLAFGLCKEQGGAVILKKVLDRSSDAKDRAAAGLALGLFEDKQHIPALRKAFDQAKDWMLMQTTMLSLGILDDKSSADAIKNVLLTKKQVGVRTSAALSYALLRQWSAIPLFTQMLRTTKSIVTLGAIAQVTGFLSSEKAATPLIDLFKDKHLQRQARAFALVAIGALGDPEPLPILVRMAFDLNYMIRSDPVDEAVTIL